MLQARRRAPDEVNRTVSGADNVRVGYTCSKKVGNAVARNRAKRRLRAAARDVLGQDGQPGWDYVLVGRANATAERPYEALLHDLRDALRRIHDRPARGEPGRGPRPQGQPEP